MEVTLLSPQSVRIKSKQGATLAVSPIGVKGKIATDGILLFDKTNLLTEIATETEAVRIAGPGEYEIKGVKLNGLGKSTVTAYTGKIDGMDVCIAKASLLPKAKESLGEYHVIIIEEDELLDQSVLAALNVNVVILYGVKAADAVKALGKEVTSVSKYAITKDKLPTEMEIVLLG